MPSTEERLWHHEAAHAVAYEWAGIPVLDVTARAGRDNDDAFDYSGRTRPTRSLAEWVAEDRSGRTSKALVVLLAGPEAGDHVLKDQPADGYHAGSLADVEEAKKLLAQFDGKLDLAAAKASAEVFVRDRWQMILAVAAELARIDVLSGDGLRKIIERCANPSAEQSS